MKALRNTATTIGLTLFATPAWAAADGHGFPWLDWAFSVINFVIFIGIIVYWAGPKITEYFTERREKLAENLDAARELREEAQAKLEEYSAKLDELDEERQTLLEQYHEQGEREKKQIVAEAKDQVEKMRNDAELIIEQEVRRAVAEIEQQAVDLALEMAREKVDARMNEGRQNVLVDRYVSELKDMRS